MATHMCMKGNRGARTHTLHVAPPVLCVPHHTTPTCFSKLLVNSSATRLRDAASARALRSWARRASKRAACAFALLASDGGGGLARN